MSRGITPIMMHDPFVFVKMIGRRTKYHIMYIANINKTGVGETSLCNSSPPTDESWMWMGNTISEKSSYICKKCLKRKEELDNTIGTGELDNLPESGEIDTHPNEDEESQDLSEEDAAEIAMIYIQHSHDPRCWSETYNRDSAKMDLLSKTGVHFGVTIDNVAQVIYVLDKWAEASSKIEEMDDDDPLDERTIEEINEMYATNAVNGLILRYTIYMGHNWVETYDKNSARSFLLNNNKIFSEVTSENIDDILDVLDDCVSKARNQQEVDEYNIDMEELIESKCKLTIERKNGEKLIIESTPEHITQLTIALTLTKKGEESGSS